MPESDSEDYSPKFDKTSIIDYGDEKTNITKVSVKIGEMFFYHLM